MATSQKTEKPHMTLGNHTVCSTQVLPTIWDNSILKVSHELNRSKSREFFLVFHQILSGFNFNLLPFFQS